jgi:cobalt/nickel transport system permease protein
LGGYLAAAVLVVFGSWRIQDEEIPHIALLTAAFFVISLIHVPIPGLPTSAHLLGNGLLGVLLGRRAALAIPIGLLLQAVLLQHGGLTTLGVNTCVMVLPALLAWQMFVGWQRLGRMSEVRGQKSSVSDEQGEGRGVARPQFSKGVEHESIATPFRSFRACHPTHEFAIGLIIGAAAVLVTVVLLCMTLLLGGTSDWRALIVLILVPHLLIAAIEGVVLGFAVRFLARVKPDMLNGRVKLENTECTVEVA